jgi:probable HAF family extracellular repeat protein
MTSTAHTLGRGGRLRVALAGAVVLVAFTVSTAMAAAAPVGAPAAELGASATSAANPRTPTPGFLLHRGRYRGFDAPQARFSTLAYGINDHGQIVGRYDDGSEQPFLRDRRGRYTTLRIPGARSAWASGINDRGQIVGIYSENTPIVKQPGGRRHGYLWEGGRVTRIDVPGATETGAFGINNQGEVVGAYLDAAGRSHGFRWKRGRVVTIDVPGVADTTPQGINDRGQVVGYPPMPPRRPSAALCSAGASSGPSAPRGCRSPCRWASTTAVRSRASPPIPLARRSAGSCWPRASTDPSPRSASPAHQAPSPSA